MGIFRRIWALGKRSKLDREIEDELGDHLRRRTDANIAKGMSAWRTADMMVGQPRDGKRVQGLEVSGEFFSVLGVFPWQGRLIEPQDEAGCNISKVVASYPYWKAQMGGEPITPNTTILVEGHAV
jgi:hypothetical protein